MAVEKMDLKSATEEINKWLDSKRIRESRREAREQQIQDLISAVQEGIITYNPDTHELNHNLVFPQDGVEMVTYKHRVSPKDVERYLKGVAANDADGRLRAWICALTNQPVNIIRNMDTEDYTISTSVALFFQ